MTRLDLDQQAPTTSGRTRDFVLLLNRMILGLSRHWLALLNAAVGLYAGLPYLSPWLMAHGHERIGGLIFSLYRFSCNQLPSHSYVVFGHQAAYCQRDTAIYTTIFLAGLAFTFVRDRLPPLPWKWYFVLIAPMALDGFTQLFGWRTSNWQLRTVTGALFGFASVWLAYPYLQIGMADLERDAIRQWERAQEGVGSRGAENGGWRVED
jgi:uncharacterized membrane protein